MVKLNFKWVKNKGQYANGEDLYLNELYLGSASWNTFVSRDDPDKDKKKYIGSTHLYRNQSWTGADIETVKQIIEHKITVWFNEALKSEK